MINYPEQMLKEIDNMLIRELFVKLELLDWRESPLKEIQGLLTGGSIQVDGSSSVRRTANFTFLIPNTDFIENDIKLNSKFKMEIGLKNRLPKEYASYGDIIWFPAGTFVFINASYSHSTSSVQVNVTAKDKMCLLNGEVGGVIPDTVVFHEYEQSDNDSTTFVQIPIFRLILELVNHYGGEDLANIFIEDIPNEIRQLIQYNGDRPIYLEKQRVAYNGQETYTGNYTFDMNKANEWDDYNEITAGKAIGYVLTDFTYPGELVSSPGQTVTDILDKIKNVLGNFEYFYDIDGKFIFREIKNYLNNSYVPIEQLNENSYTYIANYEDKEIFYSFKDNKKLISSYNNNPQYGNIKNDFVVWGKDAITELPIRYHLAIDKRPSGDSEIWQQNLYKYIEKAQANGSDAGYYEKEMLAEWKNLYDEAEDNFKESVRNNPESINYFLDFIDSSSEYGKWSVDNIGRRSIVKIDDSCRYVYKSNPPDVIFINIKEQDEGVYEKRVREGYTVAVVPETFFDYITVSNNSKSCFDVIRELLYQHLTLNESITINSIPIYWLEPNRKIEVEDDESKIYGEYMIKSFSIPLTYNGTMSISANRVLKRI